MNINAINKIQMERYIPDIQNMVAICIYSTAETPPKLPGGWKDKLFLQFDDVDEKDHGLTMFKESQAIMILNFINKNNPDKIIINCGAGISRSVGVMVALEYIYNERNVFGKFPFHNRKVANTIVKIWEISNE